MKRGAAALTVAVFVVVGGCSSGSEKVTEDRRVLPDGLRVPVGARLVGRVVPDLTSYINGTKVAETQRAWTAHLAVDGSARRVYSMIRSRAARAGLHGLAAASTACQISPDPGPTGRGTRSGGQLTTCDGSGGP